MTRKSRREIARDLDDLAADGGDGEGYRVVFKDGKSGNYYADEDLEDLVEDPDAFAGTTVTLTRNIVVMFREEAEAEDLEILGPADTDADAVRVVRE